MKDFFLELFGLQNFEKIASQFKELTTKSPITVVPETMKTVDMEKYMPNAAWYRQGYSTEMLLEYIAYLKNYAQEGTVCFVDSDRMTAKAVIDMGTVAEPLHKQHTASLNLERMVAFAAVMSFCGERQSQREAAEFVEDWADHITIYSNLGDEMSAQAASASFRNMTIDAARSVETSVGDFSESMTAMEKIEARNKESLPAEIVFNCTPYQDFVERSISIKVRILTSSSDPAFMFRIVRQESLLDEIACEFKDRLKDAFAGESIETFIGNIR